MKLLSLSFLLWRKLQSIPTIIKVNNNKVDAIEDRTEVASRTIAIGDIHGDFNAFATALTLGKVLRWNNEKFEWAGGSTKVIFVGDLLDRGDDEMKIINSLVKLKREARAAGGCVICLLGNHEIMNVCGDFRYTTKSGNSRFDKIRDEVLQHRGGSWDQFEKISEKEFPGLRTRAAAFAPGGFLAERFSRFPIAAVIHGTLFVHGGIQLSNRLSKSQDELPLRTLNRRVASWLKGDESVPPEELFGRESPIWTRRFSTPAGVDLSDEVNQELDEVLQILKVERMVVGHTPQPQGINVAGGSKVFRIDTGMCTMMGGPCEVLEITRYFSSNHENMESKVSPRLGKTHFRILTEYGPVELGSRNAFPSDQVISMDNFS